MDARPIQHPHAVEKTKAYRSHCNYLGSWYLGQYDDLLGGLPGTSRTTSLSTTRTAFYAGGEPAPKRLLFFHLFLSRLSRLETDRKELSFHRWFFPGVFLNLAGMGESRGIPATEVSTNFFATLGVRPMLGRDFADHWKPFGKSLCHQRQAHRSWSVGPMSQSRRQCWLF